MSKTRRSDLTTCTVDGEIVILDRATGYVHQLNATASEIWAACDGRQSVKDIAAHVAERFSNTSSALLLDVESALAQFERLGLLTDAHDASDHGTRASGTSEGPQ